MAGEAALLAQARLSGPMPWVVAIMVALTVIAAAAGLSLTNTTRAAADALAGGVTVQIVEADPVERARQADAVARALAAMPGVTQAYVVPQDEVERLIEPWLGARSGEVAAIPVPALVDARLRDAVTPEVLGGLRRSVRLVAPAARVDAQSGWLQPVFAAIASMQWLAATLVAVLALGLTASVLLAVRNALGANRATIEIVHLLGATDAQIARIFQRSAGFDAAVGGAFGLAAGLAAVLVLGHRFASLGAGLVASGVLGWGDWGVLVMIPVAGVVLTMLTARVAVMRTLVRML
ncbi:MAG: hypothetical protein RIQ99_531 [Pseudomonadota bacterium]|jgi:cell division transport system permease protein